MTELATTEVIERLFNHVGTPIPWELISDDNVWALRKDGEVLAVIGCQEMWSGFGQAWMAVDHDRVREKHGVWLTREARKLLRVESIARGYRQVRAMCFYQPHVAWAKLVGFTLEGVWLEAGPTSQNVYIMVYHRRH